MPETRNEQLAAWMHAHKLSAEELADLVNDAIGTLTGTYGTVSKRHVFKLLNGQVRWPHSKLRMALQTITGHTGPELGFTPRGKNPQSPAPEEDPVYRRAFLAAATAAGVSLPKSPAGEQRRHRLSSNDVEKLKAELAAWTSAENQYGGTPGLEQRAADITNEVISLQQEHSASTRIRSELYILGAAFSNSAMWAAIDGRRLDSAQIHLDRTIRLAGLSGDQGTQFRVWNHGSILFQHLKRPTDALAAAQRAQASVITRRDPLFASLALARLAVNHAELGDARNTMRYLDLAQKALDRADPHRHRPTWIEFYDQAELDHLAMLAHVHLRHWPDAEKHAHRSLAYLRPDLKRNSALARAHLAVAQLGQNEPEQALATVQDISDELVRHARVRKILDRFSQQVTTLDPHNSEARDWQAHYRTVVA
ncbi:Tat pathway signal protein [Streptomyces sp. NPDC127074]|uniref:Tat pathway signal protein n=1 Tax=Streptomyces sp. NPDC127074 TaxID=3347130 RepID=UPI003652C96B